MSLTRLAMRLAASRALRDTTLAEGRVFDSAVDPIDQTIAENRQPIIVLTTDEHEATVVGRDLMTGAQECNLVIEIAIASRVEVPASDGQGGEVTIAIPHTDEGMELTLDMMEHQVLSALTRGDNPWARIWMMLVPRITNRQSRRGASSENGVRFAARQLVLTCDLVDTPMTSGSVAPGTAWGDALTAMDADPDLSQIAGMLRAEIEDRPATDWAASAQILGVPLDVADQIGIAPSMLHDDSAATLTAVGFDADGTVTVVDDSMIVDGA